jgi:hypothetical protein
MQTSEIKRRLDELKALYQLEPSLRDLYLEGLNDLSIIRWFLTKKGKKEINVYPIEIIEVPDHAFDKANLSKHSNRNKVIVLSEELSEHFDKEKIKVRCIVDADFDRYLNRCRKNYILQYTDYSSVEMYLFNVETLEKFLGLGLKNFSVSSSKLLNDLKRILQRMFVIRLANESLSWEMTWIDIKSYISWNGKSVKFDESQFLKSYLMRNSRLKDIGRFKTAMYDFSERLDQDPRNNIQGHDFTYLFFLVVKRYARHRGRFANVETFEGTLCCCLELNSLQTERLFVKLADL